MQPPGVPNPGGFPALLRGDRDRDRREQFFLGRFGVQRRERHTPQPSQQQVFAFVRRSHPLTISEGEVLDTLDTRPDPGTVWETVGCTGHRLKNLSPAQQVWSRRQLLRAAEVVRDRFATVTAVSGMAVGTDLWFADGAVRAGLRLAAYIPNPQQTSRWPPGFWRNEHARLLAAADPGLSRMFADKFSFRSLDDRNKGIVADVDALIALWIPGRRGGTWRALCDAADARLPGIHIDPENREVTFRLPDPRRCEETLTC